MTFLTNLTLGKKITLLTTVGLLLGVGVFISLGMRAVNQATETMLQDRLTTARLVADYVDEALGRALTELKSTAQMIESDRTKDELEAQMEALEATYSRLSIYTHSIYLLNERGQVIWSKPETARLGGIDISAYPSTSPAISSGQPSISGLVSAPLTGCPSGFSYQPD